VIEAAELKGFGTYRQRLDARTYPQRIQGMHGVSAHLDAGANLPQRRRLFEHFNLMAPLQQKGSGREPAYSSADYRDFHNVQLLLERMLAYATASRLTVNNASGLFCLDSLRFDQCCPAF